MSTDLGDRQNASYYAKFRRPTLNNKGFLDFRQTDMTEYTLFIGIW